MRKAKTRAILGFFFFKLLPLHSVLFRRRPCHCSPGAIKLLIWNTYTSRISLRPGCWDSPSIFLPNQWLCHLLRSNPLPPLRAINLRSTWDYSPRRETAPGYLWNMPHRWSIRQCHRSHSSSNPSHHNEFLPFRKWSLCTWSHSDGFGVLAVQALCSVSGCSAPNVWAPCVCSEFMFLVGSQPQHNLYLPSLFAIKWIQFWHFAAQRAVGEMNIFWVWNHLQSITRWLSSHLDAVVTTPSLTIPSVSALWD